MDKQAYRKFLDNIKDAYNSGDFELVAAYGDAIDPAKLKDKRSLEMISDSYVALGKYEEALDTLYAAYERFGESKIITHKLCELSIKTGDLDGAVDFYKDYCRLSGNNPQHYILKYEIGRAGGVPAEKLAEPLEAYIKAENSDRWEYELARLYHETGQAGKCVELCDDICLWYAEGEYVKKALELKFSHTPLTPDQQRLYEKIMKDYLEPEERAAYENGGNAAAGVSGYGGGAQDDEFTDEIADRLAAEYLGEDTEAAGEAGEAREAAGGDGETREVRGDEAGESADETAETSEEAADKREAASKEAEVSKGEVQEEAADKGEAGETTEEADKNEEAEGKAGNIQDTLFIPLRLIRESLDSDAPVSAGDEEKTTEKAAEISAEEAARGAEAAENGAEDYNAAENGAEAYEEASENEESAEEEVKEVSVEEAVSEGHGSITMDQLRELIRQGNSKQAQAGLFFTYTEPTAEEIEQEEAQKAAREKAKQLAEEERLRHEAELARMAAEEVAAREAAEATARETARLEEEAAIEAVLFEARKEAEKSENPFDRIEAKASESRTEEGEKQAPGNPSGESAEQAPENKSAENEAKASESPSGEDAEKEPKNQSAEDAEKEPESPANENKEQDKDEDKDEDEDGAGDSASSEPSEPSEAAGGAENSSGAEEESGNSGEESGNSGEESGNSDEESGKKSEDIIGMLAASLAAGAAATSTLRNASSGKPDSSEEDSGKPDSDEEDSGKSVSNEEDSNEAPSNEEGSDESVSDEPEAEDKENSASGSGSEAEDKGQEETDSPKEGDEAEDSDAIAEDDSGGGDSEKSQNSPSEGGAGQTSGTGQTGGAGQIGDIEETRFIKRSELDAMLFADAEEDEEDDIGATQVFSRFKETAETEELEEELSPEEKLGAEIRQIITDSNETLERDMQETKSIHIILPTSSAQKLGCSSVRLSKYASFVEKPQLEEIPESVEIKSDEMPKIIDNVDFSYIPLSNDGSGQYGIDVELLTPEKLEDDTIEGQLSIDDMLEIFEAGRREDERNRSISEIEHERLRKIQEAVNLGAPVKLPYSMDDPIFDDIEMSSVEGEAEETEGDIFEFNLENIGMAAAGSAAIAAAGAAGAEAEASDEKAAAGETEAGEEETAGAEAETEAGEAEAETGETESGEAEAETEAETGETESGEAEAAEEESAADETEKAAAGETEACEEGTAGAEAETETGETETAEMGEETRSLTIGDAAVAAAIAEFEMMDSAERGEKGLEEDFPDEDAQFEMLMSELSSAEEEPESEDPQEALEGELFDEIFGAIAAGAEYGISDGSDISGDESQSFEDETGGSKESFEDETGGSEESYSLPDNIREELSELLLEEGMEERICECVSNIVKTKKSGDNTGGNLVVTGDIKTGKTFLGIELVKAVDQELEITNGKVAKVQAELLNGKNIDKVLEKIAGSDLIIENIGYLDDDTVLKLADAMSEGKFDNMVIVEGNQLAVESLFAGFPQLRELFRNRIDVNELSIAEWADVAVKYADEEGYILDDMALLALHAKISEINVPTSRLGYDDVIAIMDKAISHAEKRNSGNLFAAFKKNSDTKQEIIESDLT